MTEVAEAPGAERAQELKRIKHWIDGTPVAGESGRSGPVYNPALACRPARSTSRRSRRSIAPSRLRRRPSPPGARCRCRARPRSSSASAHSWTSTARTSRKILTAEHGKVLSDAMGEVARGLEVIEFCCGIPELLKGGFTEQASTGIDVYSIRQPLGVCAGITPFNFPAMVPMWMWAPALACGNTFVLKPSEKDPSASVYTAELLKEAGVPDGVFNVVHGDKVAVDALLEHPDIAAISFVGSTPIANYVYETGTSHGKRVQALGGAKNHMIVLPDADIDMAADAAVSAGYGSAGERCMAVSHAGRGRRRRRRARRGDQGAHPEGEGRRRDEPDSEMGPLVTREHRDKVASYIDKGRDEGATVVADGRETRARRATASSSASR